MLHCSNHLRTDQLRLNSFPKGEFLIALEISSPSFLKSGSSKAAWVWASTLCMGSVERKLQTKRPHHGKKGNNRVEVSSCRISVRFFLSATKTDLTEINAFVKLTVLSQVALVIHHQDVMVEILRSRCLHGVVENGGIKVDVFVSRGGHLVHVGTMDGREECICGYNGGKEGKDGDETDHDWQVVGEMRHWDCWISRR